MRRMATRKLGASAVWLHARSAGLYERVDWWHASEIQVDETEEQSKFIANRLECDGIPAEAIEQVWFFAERVEILITLAGLSPSLKDENRRPLGVTPWVTLGNP